MTPLRMRIIGWEALGLRCPDHKVCFENDEGDLHPISLIQMPNGTGKTTTLEMIRAALSGGAREWSGGDVRELRKKSGGNEQGTFEIALLQNEKRVTIRMILDFDEGSVRYQTNPGVGLRDGFHPPLGLQRFLREEFVNFFIFDGELAERLLDRNSTNAEAVIEDLFHLRNFRRVRGWIEEYWKDETQKKGAKGDTGFTKRRNRVENLERRMKELHGARKRTTEELEGKSSELSRLRERFQESLEKKEELRERLLKAGSSFKETKQEVHTLSQSIFSKMRCPHALSKVFARDLHDLRTNLDRVKLPETTAREFFQELAEEEFCVCGREIDETAKTEIKKRSHRYLGSNDVSLLNLMKDNIKTMVGDGDSAGEEEGGLKAMFKELAELRKREIRLRNELDEIEHEGTSNDPELEEVQRTIEELELEVERLDTERRKFEDPSDIRKDESTGVEVIHRRLEDARNKYAEATATMRLKECRDVLTRILETSHGRARRGVAAAICEETNERCESLMPDNEIRVESIDKCLKLRGQRGGSVGETLSMGYSFLATLFNRTAEHQLPFVVDSPANPIDLKVRRKLAELVPRLTDQFIAFTISAEKGGFLVPLEEAATKPLQYLTLFRAGASDLEELAEGESGLVRTEDGFCVEGREFFHRFHQDEEGSGAV